MSPASPGHARPRVVAGLRLVHLVGEGSEGEVWDARDRGGRRRALKLIRPDALVPPDEVERRGRWLLAIDHPALVSVHRCGVLAGAGLDGWGFVEMSFVDGHAMDDAPAQPDILERLSPLAEALDHLHAGTWSEGVPLVHRDVKPANLIEDADGALVLVDVSTLRDVDDGVRTRIGTPLYAAPEVVTGRAGPLADVYAFGATAVALLTGARRGELARLLAEPHLLDVPDGVRAALSTDPAQRPVSCRAALDPRLPLIVGREVGWQHVPAVGFDPTAVDRPHPQDVASDEAPAWLPSATDVLLDPWHEPTAYQRRSTWGWLVLLAGLTAGLAWAVPSAGRLSATAPRGEWLGLGAIAAAHLVACLAGGRTFGEALVPPVAWGSLLAERAAPPGARRAWARASLTACACALLAVGLFAGAGPERLDIMGAVALGGAALAAAVGSIHAADAGRLWRVVLAPAWAAGVALLTAGAALLLLPALLVGRGSRLLAAVARTLGGAAAFVRR